ncbi:MAG: nuclear transport factor 2 family protein [Chitinophagaceae bacterium]|nr:nuclear transport factor 2 family protein [Chitinophagaceae bacterium]
MKKNNQLLLLLLIAGLSACNQTTKTADYPVLDSVKEQSQITAMLDSFNRAAAKADFNAYFDFYTDDAIFAGTDATERWDKQQFMAWAKPIFAKGKAWDFTAMERHIYFDKTGTLAWFDELLKTQMKICRGSGVLIKQGDDWKLQQYILSTMVPNDDLDAVIKIKARIEDSIINQLSVK